MVFRNLTEVRDNIQENLIHSGGCGVELHEPCLTFHDTIGVSPAMSARGVGGTGVDSSIGVFAEIEMNLRANSGVDDIISEQAPSVASRRIMSHW